MQNFTFSEFLFDYKPFFPLNVTTHPDFYYKDFLVHYTISIGNGVGLPIYELSVPGPLLCVASCSFCSTLHLWNSSCCCKWLSFLHSPSPLGRHVGCFYSGYEQCFYKHYCIDLGPQSIHMDTSHSGISSVVNRVCESSTSMDNGNCSPKSLLQPKLPPTIIVPIIRHPHWHLLLSNFKSLPMHLTCISLVVNKMNLPSFATLVDHMNFLLC